MKLTTRQREILESYAEAERLELSIRVPREVERIARLDGHAHGMAVWGLNRVLIALERKGLMLFGRVTDKGRAVLRERRERRGREIQDTRVPLRGGS